MDTVSQPRPSGRSALAVATRGAHAEDVRVHQVAYLSVLMLMTGTVACSSRDAGSGTSTATTETSATSTSPSTSDVASSVATSTTLSPSTAPTVPAGPTPGAVTITYSGSGGGSGEIQIDWNAATNATSYRVYRATSAAGPFTMMANVNVVTGAVVVHDGVVNVWGDRQTFVPGPYATSGVSTEFHYVEVPFTGGGSHGYFRVIAYNDSGRGPIGATVCAEPFGVSDC